jgi:hypothetical protein
MSGLLLTLRMGTAQIDMAADCLLEICGAR